MRFSIGYQLPGPDDAFPDIVSDYREHISEVYFAVPGDPSGRAPLSESSWDSMISDLSSISDMGVSLVLLFNSACYGPKAISAELESHVHAVLKRLQKRIPIDTVTTTSVFIARTVKDSYPDIKVRASVNMRIGSIRGMEQTEDYFDGYYMKRDWNRDPDTIKEFSAWRREQGKSLHMLANSGCLYDCAFQSFHDNLVAHEGEMKPEDSMHHRYPAPCWEYLDSEDAWVNLLQNTWVRPEEIFRYEEWFDTVKLATRMHSHPRMVIGAYAQGKFRGNILDLLEPNHSPLIRPRIIDNERFPEDWFEKSSSCSRNCRTCGYCREVLEQVMVNISETVK